MVGILESCAAQQSAHEDQRREKCAEQQHSNADIFDNACGRNDKMFVAHAFPQLKDEIQGIF
jgi:hypothetical protein